MKITGELLKTARINKNLSVQDVALSLKLSSKIINSLESGNIDDLPAKTFVRGFVKSYAQLLKVDADVVLRQFQEEMGSTSPLPKVPPPAPVNPQVADTIKATKPALKHTSQNYANKTPAAIEKANLNTDQSSKQIGIMIGLAVVVVIILIVGNKIFQSFSEDPVAVTEPVVSENTSPASADATLTAENPLEATNAPSTDVTVAASTEASPPTETVQEAVASQTTINSLPEDGFQKSNGKPVEVIFEAKKDVEIFYAKGNSKQFSSLKLQANHVHILRSKVGLYIKSTDGGAFKISVDGVEMGPAGASNKEVRLSF